MRILSKMFLVTAALAAGGDAFAQQAPRVAALPVPATAEAASKFTFILFYKEDNAATQDMAAKLKGAVAKKSALAEWTPINAADPANLATVERYKVSRMPMPMVMCVAPNGAITAAFSSKVTDEVIDQALVTPSMTSCMKAMQDGKLVVVHVRATERATMPAGAATFAADPEFYARTAVVSFALNDPREGRFLTEMGVPPTTTASVVAVLAPPGVLVGKFAEATTKEQIAAAVHAAGKCCDDPNCKHNKPSK